MVSPSSNGSLIPAYSCNSEILNEQGHIFYNRVVMFPGQGMFGLGEIVRSRLSTWIDGWWNM